MFSFVSRDWNRLEPEDIRGLDILKPFSVLQFQCHDPVCLLTESAKKTSNKADRHAVMWTFNGVSSRRIDVNWLWPSCHKSLIYSGCNFSCCPGTVYMSHEPVLISEMSLPFRLQCERRGEILLLGRNDVLWGKLHDSVQFVHLHLIYMTTECNFYHQESLKVRDHGSFCLRRYSGGSCLYMYANTITRINVSKVSFCRS